MNLHKESSSLEVQVKSGAPESTDTETISQQRGAWKRLRAGRRRWLTHASQQRKELHNDGGVIGWVWQRGKECTWIQLFILTLKKKKLDFCPSSVIYSNVTLILLLWGLFLKYKERTVSVFFSHGHWKDISYCKYGYLARTSLNANYC